jgi:hypothetical protein
VEGLGHGSASDQARGRRQRGGGGPGGAARPATEAEIDDRRLGGLRLGVEELPRCEAERAGDEVARDGRDRVL